MENEEQIRRTRFLELAAGRHSVRKFDGRPVEREKIITCVEVARLAPSAENVQPWRFFVLDDPQTRQGFGAAAFSGVYRFTRWALEAPVLVALFAERDILANRLGKQIQGTGYYLIDVGIAGEHLVLQAQELGLGSCWIGWFNARKAAGYLQVPRSWRLAAILALGYPAEKQPAPREKKPLSEVLYFNRYKK